jgi:hypothetical protein
MANGFIIPDDLKLYLGKYPNDGTGDDLYTAFDKVKRTFELINTNLGATTALNVGSGAGVFSVKEDNILKFKSLTEGTGITITQGATSLEISSIGYVEGDPSPTLGGDLSLDGNNIIGAGSPGATGDVRATVWGFDVRELNTQIQTALNANFGDFGTFDLPTGSTFDLGTF